jgi:hypothetical protein
VITRCLPCDFFGSECTDTDGFVVSTVNDQMTVEATPSLGVDVTTSECRPEARSTTEFHECGQGVLASPSTEQVVVAPAADPIFTVGRRPVTGAGFKTLTESLLM